MFRSNDEAGVPQMFPVKGDRQSGAFAAASRKACPRIQLLSTNLRFISPCRFAAALSGVNGQFHNIFNL
jgi:hypothetical protein